MKEKRRITSKIIGDCFMNQTNNINERIQSLQGARFIAMFIIVLSHLEFLREYSWHYWVYFHNATFGVDFFFMLSGFGMMLSFMGKPYYYEKAHFSFRESVLYALKHIKKIYAVYVAMLLIGMPYSVMDMINDHDYSLGQALAESLMHFLIDITMLQSLSGISLYSHSLNGVSWFLSCLFCIYLISLPLMKYIYSKKNNKLFVYISPIAVCMISWAFAASFEWMEKNTVFDDLCYGSPFRRFLYVLIGMLIAVIYTKHCNIWGWVEYIVLFLCIGWFLYRNSAVGLIQDMKYMIDVLLCGTLLYVLAIGKGKVSDIFSNRVMVYLGNISMYVFLVHYLVIRYTLIVIGHFFDTSLAMYIISSVVGIIISYAISAGLYKKCRNLI